MVPPRMCNAPPYAALAALSPSVTAVQSEMIEWASVTWASWMNTAPPFAYALSSLPTLDALATHAVMVVPSNITFPPRIIIAPPYEGPPPLARAVQSEMVVLVSDVLASLVYTAPP